MCRPKYSYHIVVYKLISYPDTWYQQTYGVASCLMPRDAAGIGVADKFVEYKFSE